MSPSTLLAIGVGLIALGCFLDRIWNKDLNWFPQSDAPVEPPAVKVVSFQTKAAKGWMADPQRVDEHNAKLALFLNSRNQRPH